MFDHRLLRTAGALLGLTAIAALPACDFSGFLPGQGHTLTITPESAIFHAVGDEMELTALSEGHNVNVTWASSDTTIARISSEGVLAAASSGSARVTARSETGAEQSVRVRVDPIVDGLTVASRSNPYEVGDRVDFQAWGVDRNGHPVANTPATWASSNQRVATINRQGRMTAREGGTATITARSHGHEAEKTVLVDDPREANSAPTAPSNLTASAIGTAIVLSWDLNSSNADEVRVYRKEDADADWTRVSTRSGTSTAWIDENKRQGFAYQYVVKARNGVGTSDASNEVTVSVRSPESGEEPSSVAIVAGNTTLTAIGNTTRLSAQVLGESGAAFEGHEVRWSSDNHRVATVSADGTVTARGAGRVRISATAECCEEATVTITVRQIIATVAVALASTTLAADQTTQAVATAKDANGHEVVNPGAVWSSSDESVARVDRNGTVTGRSEGSAEIRAEADGRSDSARLTVEERMTDSPAPPAATGTFPNEPAGFRTAVYHDLSCVPSKSSCTGTDGQGEWDSWGVNGNLTMVNEPVSSLGTSTFMRARYPEGFVGGGAPYRLRGTFGKRQGNDQREIYVSMYMRIPTETFEHHPVATKIVYLPHGSRSANNWGTFNLRHIHGEHRTASGGGYISERSRAMIQFRETMDWGSTPTDQQNTNYYFPHQRWVHVEIVSRPADIDRANGIVRVWFDGNLVIERTDVRNRFTHQTSDGTEYFDQPHWEFHHIPVWGGGNNKTKSRDDFIDYGHYYVSGTPFDRLETPSNVRVETQGDRNVLSWRSGSSRHDGFDVFRWKESDGHGSRVWKHIGTVDASTTSYRDFFVDRGHRYHYHVRAVNGDGESLPSATEAVTTR